jgi:hypothetical protein
MACSIYCEHQGSWEKLCNELNVEENTYVVVDTLGNCGFENVLCLNSPLSNFQKERFDGKERINQKLGFGCLVMSCHTRTSLALERRL